MFFGHVWLVRGLSGCVVVVVGDGVLAVCPVLVLWGSHPAPHRDLRAANKVYTLKTQSALADKVCGLLFVLLDVELASGCMRVPVVS